MQGTLGGASAPSPPHRINFHAVNLYLPFMRQNASILKYTAPIRCFDHLQLLHGRSAVISEGKTKSVGLEEVCPLLLFCPLLAAKCARCWSLAELPASEMLGWARHQHLTFNKSKSQEYLALIQASTYYKHRKKKQ